MNCGFCEHYVNSERRIEPKGEEKKASNRRLCDPKKKWVSYHDDLCDEYTTAKNFYCERRHCQMNVDACKNSHDKKLSRHCKNCSQFYDVLDAIRFRSRNIVKAATAEPLKSNAVITRRRKNERKGEGVEP